MAVRRGQVAADTFTMDYFAFGRGKKTFVILPGLSIQSVSGAAEAVEAGYAAFSEEYTVYVFDRRLDLPPVYTIEDMARDTAEAMRALSLSDVYLFGASQGGMIALIIAARYPGLVRKLVLGPMSRKTGRELWISGSPWQRKRTKKDCTLPSAERSIRRLFLRHTGMSWQRQGRP